MELGKEASPRMSQPLQIFAPTLTISNKDVLWDLFASPWVGSTCFHLGTMTKEQLPSTQPRGLKQELGKTVQKKFKKNIIELTQKLGFPVTFFLGLKESEGKCK